MKPYRTKQAHCSIHPSGWWRLPSGVEITSLPLVRIVASAGTSVARQCGANDWMAKPFDARALQERVLDGIAKQQHARTSRV